MKSKSLLAIIVVLLISSGFIRAQKDQVAIEEIKAIYKPQIIKVLEDYQVFNQFTSNGESIDTTFFSKFASLFANPNDVAIYNDLKFAGISAPDYLSPREYAKFVKANYQYGLDIVLVDLKNFEFVNISEQKGIYSITVKVTKKLNALYRFEKIHKTSNPIYVTFNALNVQGGGSPLRINRISNEAGYKSLAASSKMKGVYIGLKSGIGNSTLVNSFSFWSPTSQKNVLKGFELTIFFNQSFGIGTGISISTHSTNYLFDLGTNYQQPAQTDLDGDSYIPLISTNNLIEQDKIQSLDIPILLKFRTGNARTGLYIDLGIIYSKLSKGSYSLDGKLTRKGKYPAFNDVIIEEIPVDGFNFQTFTYPSAQSSSSTAMNIPSSGLSAYGALGLSFPLSQGLFLKIGSNFIYSLQDLPISYSNHWILQDNKYPVKIKSIGLEVGLSYKLSGK